MTASLSIMLHGKGIEVLGFIDTAHASAGFIHVDLVNATRLLSKPPVSRERHFQKFKQQGTVIPTFACRV
jgi:hypothetical protein